MVEALKFFRPFNTEQASWIVDSGFKVERHLFGYTAETIGINMDNATPRATR
jgi:hypothetical protein